MIKIIYFYLNIDLQEIWKINKLIVNKIVYSQIQVNLKLENNLIIGNIFQKQLQFRITSEQTNKNPQICI